MEKFLQTTMSLKLSIPAFTKGRTDWRLPEEEVTATRRIANVRIHVERAIKHLKYFKLLANVILGRVKNLDDILIAIQAINNKRRGGYSSGG